jgi:hypothetical protein
MYNWQVHFDSAGNHMRSVHYWAKDTTHRDNYVFRDSLRLISISSKGAKWKSTTNDVEYTSFISDVNRFIHLLRDGVVKGVFTFRNNGGYTSLIPFDKIFEDYISPGK